MTVSLALCPPLQTSHSSCVPQSLILTFIGLFLLRIPSLSLCLGLLSQTTPQNPHLTLTSSSPPQNLPSSPPVLGLNPQPFPGPPLLPSLLQSRPCNPLWRVKQCCSYSFCLRRPPLGPCLRAAAVLFTTVPRQGGLPPLLPLRVTGALGPGTIHSLLSYRAHTEYILLS